MVKVSKVRRLKNFNPASGVPFILMESIFSMKAKLSRNILLIHLIPLLSLGDPISDYSTLQPQEPQPFDSKPFQTTFITDTQLAQERTSRLKSRNRRSNKQRGGGTPDGKDLSNDLSRMSPEEWEQVLERLDPDDFKYKM